MGYIPWGCKESDVSEQLSEPSTASKQFRKVVAIICSHVRDREAEAKKVEQLVDGYSGNSDG